MGNIGATEILLIATVAILLFGAGRIPDISKGLAEAVNPKNAPNDVVTVILLLVALLIMAVYWFALLAARHP